jgi:hypothetical protein
MDGNLYKVEQELLEIVAVYSHHTHSFTPSTRLGARYESTLIGTVPGHWIS